MDTNETNSTTESVVNEVSTIELAESTVSMEETDPIVPDVPKPNETSTNECTITTNEMELAVPAVTNSVNNPYTNNPARTTNFMDVTEATVVETPTETNMEMVNSEENSTVNNSLSLLTQYESGSSDDSSEDSSSESESSSDSSSSSSEDEVEEVPLSKESSYRNPKVKIEISSESENESFMSDDDNENVGRNTKSIPRPIKVEGELLISDLPPIEELHITVPEQECIQLGTIHSIVEQIVLVNSLPGTVPLNIDTVLFLDKGTKTLGKVFDVIGQVSDPLYCILFNSNAEILSKGISVGTPVYCAPKTTHTSFIILSDLMKTRGSDASWQNDCEPPDRYLDYSDDEKERSARKNRVGYRNDSEVINVDEDPSAARPKHYRQSYPGPQRRPFRRNRGQSYRFPNPHHVQSPNNYSWHHNYNQPYQQPTPFINPYAAPPVQHPNLFLNPFAIPPPPPPRQ